MDAGSIETGSRLLLNLKPNSLFNDFGFEPSSDFFSSFFSVMSFKRSSSLNVIALF
jgi:hypothetical protein